MDRPSRRRRRTRPMRNGPPPSATHRAPHRLTAAQLRLVERRAPGERRRPRRGRAAARRRTHRSARPAHPADAVVGRHRPGARPDPAAPRARRPLPLRRRGVRRVGLPAVTVAGQVALFSGPSGTGKTLAAEIIAGDLGLDLFKLDLSAVVSKYIGETEKNLDQVFDAARPATCVLFFDEADALFGKRSEVTRRARPLRQHRGVVPPPAARGLRRARRPGHQLRAQHRRGVPAPDPRARRVRPPRRGRAQGDLGPQPPVRAPRSPPTSTRRSSPASSSSAAAPSATPRSRPRSSPPPTGASIDMDCLIRGVGREIPEARPTDAGPGLRRTTSRSSPADRPPALLSRVVALPVVNGAPDHVQLRAGSELARGDARTSRR